MSYERGGPDDVMTLIMDIEQFRHLRKHRGMWQHQGIFAEREIERRWARRPPAIREWEGIEFVVPIAIKAAFDEGSWLHTVRLWIGDTENDALTVCRVSVEAKRWHTRYDWRYDKRAKGYLAPVTPHGDPPPTLLAMGLAEDPYDFEQQVAQMLRNRGLVVEVTGGSGDEGIDVIAYDDTPITGGTYLVQCKRYSPDHKVGVSEVRELYGTMQEKHAAKGVLVTSSTFTAGALRFAEDKSIELIDGAKLSNLIASEDTPVLVTDTPTAVPDVYLKADLDFSEPTDMKPSNASDPTELLLAVQEGDLMALARAVNGGFDIDATNENGVTALQLAITGGNLTVLRMVLASGANVNARYGILTPLIFAIDHGHADVVSVLLEHGADANLPGENGFTPLHLAVARAQHAIVSLLISHGANVNAVSQEGHTPLVGFIWRMTQGESSDDDFNIVVELIQAGADIQPVRKIAAEAGLEEWLLNLSRLLGGGGQGDATDSGETAKDS